MFYGKIMGLFTENMFTLDVFIQVFMRTFGLAKEKKQMSLKTKDTMKVFHVLQYKIKTVHMYNIQKLSAFPNISPSITKFR